jgi:hypothetical protein
MRLSGVGNIFAPVGCKIGVIAGCRWKYTRIREGFHGSIVWIEISKIAGRPAATQAEAPDFVNAQAK